MRVAGPKLVLREPSGAADFTLHANVLEEPVLVHGEPHHQDAFRICEKSFREPRDRGVARGVTRSAAASRRLDRSRRERLSEAALEELLDGSLAVS